MWGLGLSLWERDELPLRRPRQLPLIQWDIEVAVLLPLFLWKPGSSGLEYEMLALPVPPPPLTCIIVRFKAGFQFRIMSVFMQNNDGM